MGLAAGQSRHEPVRTGLGLARSSILFLILGTILSCLVSQGLAKNGEVVTNSFYVKVSHFN
jgi:hypothetical protein